MVCAWSARQAKNKPAVCPPLRPLSVSLTLSFFPVITLPPPLSSSGNSPCGVSVRFCKCLFVCLCLLHNSWIGFVLLNLAMGLIIAVKTEREKCCHWCILQLWDIENIRLSVSSHMLVIYFTQYCYCFTVPPKVVRIWISSKPWDIITKGIWCGRLHACKLIWVCTWVCLC